MHNSFKTRINDAVTWNAPYYTDSLLITSQNDSIKMKYKGFWRFMIFTDRSIIR